MAGLPGLLPETRLCSKECYASHSPESCLPKPPAIVRASVLAVFCLAFGLLCLPPPHLDSSDLSTCWEHRIASACLPWGMQNLIPGIWMSSQNIPDLSLSFLCLRLDFDCFFFFLLFPSHPYPGLSWLPLVTSVTTGESILFHRKTGVVCLHKTGLDPDFLSQCICFP